MRRMTVGLLVCAAALPGWSCGRSAAAAPRDPALVKRGAYLAAYGGCGDCHTPKVMSPQGPINDTTRLLSGFPGSLSAPPAPAGLSMDGWAAASTADLTAWIGPWGVTFAANLTPDSTGLGRWTEQSFIASMRTGKHLGTGRDILPPMPWQGIAGLTDADLKALFAYLRTIKPVRNHVPDPIPPAAGR